MDDYDEEDYNVEYLIDSEEGTNPVSILSQNPSTSTKIAESDKPKAKYAMWTNGDTEALLKSAEKFRDLVQVNRNLFYEKMCRHLGTKHNVGAIRQKFKNLVQSYKRHLEHQNKCGRDRSKFKYADIMDRIMEKSRTIVNTTLVQLELKKILSR